MSDQDLGYGGCPVCGAEPWVNIDCGMCLVMSANEDLRTKLQALVQEWRRASSDYFGENDIQATFERCADELEALLGGDDE